MSNRQNDFSMMVSVTMVLLTQSVIYVELYQALKGGASILLAPETWTMARWTNWLAFAAFSIQAYIAYLTCKMSNSIILSEASLKDKILNSCALAFILEFDNLLFRIMKEAHLVEVKSNEELVVSRISSALSEEDDEQKQPCSKDEHLRKQSKRVAMTLLGLISVHQLMHMCFAIESGWLPATLTICQGFSPLAHFGFLEGSVVKAFKKTLDFCEEHKASEQTYLHQLSVTWEVHPHVVLVWCLFVLLCLTTMLVRSCGDQGASCSEDDCEASPSSARGDSP